MKEAKRVRFTETVELLRVGKPTIVYHEGVEYSLRADRANRWIRREKAVEVSPIPIPEIDVTRLDSAAHRMVTSNANEAAARGQGIVSATPIRDAKPGDIASYPDQSAKGTNDGDTVAGASDVSGANSGGAGQRGQYGAGRGRGGSRGRSSGSSHE